MGVALCEPPAGDDDVPGRRPGGEFGIEAGHDMVLEDLEARLPGERELERHQVAVDGHVVPELPARAPEQPLAAHDSSAASISRGSAMAPRTAEAATVSGLPR